MEKKEFNYRYKIENFIGFVKMVVYIFLKLFRQINLRSY